VTGCKCGKVELKFFNYTPRMHCYCCCIDCNDAFRWAETQGGPPKRIPASECYYWDNDFEVVRGDEFIKFYLLNEGYMTTRLVTSCCYSTLIGHHPAYGGHHVAVYHDYVKRCEYIPKQCILTLNDLTTDQREWVEKFDLGPFTFEEAGSEYKGRYNDFKEMFSDPCNKPFMDTFETECATSYGTTVDALMEKHGVTTLDWKNSNPDARAFPDALEANMEFIAELSPTLADRL